METDASHGRTVKRTVYGGWGAFRPLKNGRAFLPIDRATHVQPEARPAHLPPARAAGLIGPRDS